MTHYAIIGGGRLARHMHHYFKLLDIPCSVWARNPDCDLNTVDETDTSLRLERVIEPATHILLAVTDSAIRPVLSQYPQCHQKTLLHGSGSQSFPGVAGVHPLMTFADQLYSPDTYLNMPFIIEKGMNFSEVLPGLANPHFSIAVEDKARYHAMCVMAGNFSQILWSTAARQLETMGLPGSVLNPYLQQVNRNYLRNGEAALTGPLNRGDAQTINRHLSVLDGDPLGPLYKEFVELHNLKKHSPWPKEATP